MRLITHNLLACHAKTCQAPANFPLRFADCTRVEVQEAEFNAEFMRCVAPSIIQFVQRDRRCRTARPSGCRPAHMLSNFIVKIDWPALLGAARQVRREQHSMLTL